MQRKGRKGKQPTHETVSLRAKWWTTRRSSAAGTHGLRGSAARCGRDNSILVSVRRCGKPTRSREFHVPRTSAPPGSRRQRQNPGQPARRGRIHVPVDVRQVEQLVQAHLPDPGAGLLDGFASGGRIEGFTVLHEPGGQRPEPRRGSIARRQRSTWLPQVGSTPATMLGFW